MIQELDLHNTIQQCQPLAFGDGLGMDHLKNHPRIGGIPMLLGDEPQRRPRDHQDHADTGSSIWDGAVALAKARIVTVGPGSPWLWVNGI